MAYLEVHLLGSLIVSGVGRKGQILEQPARIAEAFELGNRAAETVNRVH